MTKEKINEIAIRIIHEANTWDCISDEKEVARIAVYTSGVIEMARAIVKEWEGEET